MNRLARDGTAEPLSQDPVLRCERGQENIHFPCLADRTTSRIGNLTQLIYTLLFIINDDDTYTYIMC